MLVFASTQGRREVFIDTHTVDSRSRIRLPLVFVALFLSLPVAALEIAARLEADS